MSALDRINDLRRDLGIGPPLDEMPPLNGRCSGYSCPVAIALGVDDLAVPVDGQASVVVYVERRALLLRDGRRVELPAELTDLIITNDFGRTMSA